MTIPADDEPRAAGFFGRRKGKRLRDDQAGRLIRLLPQVQVDVSKPVENPAALFGAPVSEVRLEIGFGGGEHLADAAAREPGVGFIGCEPFVNGVVKLLAEIEHRALQNVRIHNDNASDLLVQLPAASIDRVYLLYADPWPKRRQRKRRFVSEAALNALARVMRPGAQFRFASDIDDYVGWTLAHVARNPHFRWVDEVADDWRTPYPDWPGTRYEAKAMREGRTPSYLTFVRI